MFPEGRRDPLSPVEPTPLSSQPPSTDDAEHRPGDENGHRHNPCNYVLPEHIGDARLITVFDPNVDHKVDGHDGADNTTDDPTDHDVGQPRSPSWLHDSSIATQDERIKSPTGDRSCRVGLQWPSRHHLTPACRRSSTPQRIRPNPEGALWKWLTSQTGDYRRTSICRYSVTRKKFGGAFVPLAICCQAASFVTSLGDTRSN